MTSGTLITAAALFLAGVIVLLLVIRAMAGSDARWFASVLQASDGDLAAGTAQSLIRSCSRMDEILLDINNFSGVNRSWITEDLALRQLRRLSNALRTATLRERAAAASAARVQP